MKAFYVYQHPKYGQKIEKDGFTFLGFFFTFIWLLVKKLYKPAVLFFLLFFVVTFTDRVIIGLMESKIKQINNMSQAKLNKIDNYRDIYWQVIEPKFKSKSDDEKLKLATTAYAEGQVLYLRMIEATIWVFVISFQFFVGFKGRNWVLKNLERRGFELTAQIKAHTKDAVIAELLRKSEEKSDHQESHKDLLKNSNHRLEKNGESSSITVQNSAEKNRRKMLLEDLLNKADHRIDIEEYETVGDLVGKAALDGNPKAKFLLGCLYRDGRVLIPDKEEAIQWFKKAAMEDYEPALEEFNRLRNRDADLKKSP